MMWLRYGGAQRCTICFHEYLLKDVYRKDTPSTFPLWILARGGLNVIVSMIDIIGWYVLNGLRWFTSFYVNGAFMWLVLGIRLDDAWRSPKGVIRCMVTGVPLMWLSRAHMLLFEHIRRREWRPRTRERVIVEETPLDMNDEEMATEECSDDEEVTIEKMGFVSIHDICTRDFFFGFVKTTACGLFLPAVYLVSGWIPVPMMNASFCKFLVQVGLSKMYPHAVMFGMVFWLLVFQMDGVTMRYGSEGLKQLRVFLRIHHIIISSVVLMYVTLGLVVHYAFGNLLNGGWYVLGADVDHRPLVYGAASLVVHGCLGYVLSMLVRNTCLRFKTYLRPGVLHFIPEDSESLVDELYEAALLCPYEVIFRVLVQLAIVATIYTGGMWVVCVVDKGVPTTLRIHGLLGMNFFFKLVSVLIASKDALNDYLVPVLNRMVLLEARAFGVANFMYNRPAARCSRRNLFWCPNRNKMFPRRRILAWSRKIPTRKDVLELLNAKHVADFGVFYIPRHFSVAIVAIMASVVLVYGAVWAVCICLARMLVRKLSIGAHVGSANGMATLLMTAWVSRAFWTVASVGEALYKGRSVTDAVGRLCKYGMVNAYVHLVYPLLGSLALVLLSGSPATFDEPEFVRLFVFLFSNTFVVETVVKQHILRLPPDEYPFWMLLRELYKINVFVSILFGTWYVYSTVSAVLGLGGPDFVAFCMISGYVLFMLCRVTQGLARAKGLFHKLFDKAFLLERRVLDVDVSEDSGQ